MAKRNINSLFNSLQTGVQQGLDNPAVFTPTTSGLAGLSDTAIGNLIAGSQQRGLGTSITAPTATVTPTETSLQTNIPIPNANTLAPVSLGTDLTPAERAAQIRLQQTVRDSLSARGLDTSPAGAAVEARTGLQFEQGIIDRRFQQERALTDEAIRLDTARFGQEATAAKFGLTQTELQDRLLSSAANRAAQQTQSQVQVENLRLQAENARVQEQNALFNQELQAVQLGLQARDVQFNENLAVFTTNLSSALGSRDTALQLVQLVAQGNKDKADELLQQKSIDASKRNSLVGAIGGLLGTSAGIAAAALFPPAAPVIAPIVAGGLASTAASAGTRSLLSRSEPLSSPDFNLQTDSILNSNFFAGG